MIWFVYGRVENSVEKKKMVVTSIFFFSYFVMFCKDFLLGYQKSSLYGKGILQVYAPRLLIDNMQDIHPYAKATSNIFICFLAFTNTGVL